MFLTDSNSIKEVLAFPANKPLPAGGEKAKDADGTVHVES